MVHGTTHTCTDPFASSRLATCTLSRRPRSEGKRDHPATSTALDVHALHSHRGTADPGLWPYLYCLALCGYGKCIITKCLWLCSLHDTRNRFRGLPLPQRLFAQLQLPNAAIARESASAESPDTFHVITIKTAVAA